MYEMHKPHRMLSVSRLRLCPQLALYMTLAPEEKIT